MRLLLLLVTCLMLAAVTPDGGSGESFDFRYDILPVLHRHGCASAYCHGSATGRGGFKLSLFASDPAADHRTITRELGGRRLDLRAPVDSLLIKKPSMRTKHGGGRRLRAGDAAHRALVDWIGAGAPYRAGISRELVSLDLAVVENQLRAVARFRTADGEFERDVTELCTFRSSDDRVAAVDKKGRIAHHGPGEAWLFARYVGQSARLALVRPFAASPAATEAVSHPLDQLWLARLHELGLAPGPRAATPVIARRLHIDLVDRVPTPDELRAFDALPAGTRVAQTTRSLMATEDFAIKFGRLLAGWLEIPLASPARPNPRTGMFQGQHRLLVEALHRGDQLPDIAERLLLRDRRLLDRFVDPRDRAEWTGRAFLGVRIGCARCHNSPVDRWEREHHLAYSAFFADKRPLSGGGMAKGILFHPETGAPVAPAVLPVATAGRPTDANHAETVAWFILRGGHKMFERNMANRIFAALIGRGLVEPLDDHRLSNPPRHETLLVHLADRMQHGLRSMVSHIVTSRLYQTSSRGGGDAERRFFARHEARPMTAATFAHAVARSLDVPAPSQPLPRSPLARQLALLNSEFLHAAVADSRMIEGIVQFAPDARARLRDIFTLLLSRPPREAEIEAFLPMVERHRDGTHDLAFALLASREFGSIR